MFSALGSNWNTALEEAKWMTEMGLCFQNEIENKFCDTEAFHRPVIAYIQGQIAYSAANNTCTVPHTMIICK